MRRFLGLLLCVSLPVFGDVSSYYGPSGPGQFPTMTTVSANGNNTTVVTTSSAPVIPADANPSAGNTAPLTALVEPESTTPQGTSGTAVLGQLAGALTANKAANSTGNQAAINATQSNLINTEAALVSSSSTAILSRLLVQARS